MLHIFEGQIFSFLTTDDSQCSCLRELSVIWLCKPTKEALEPGAKFSWGVFLFNEIVDIKSVIFALFLSW